MKKQTNNGRTFYRILITLLSCVLIMSAVTSALIAYQNRHNVAMHTGVLTNSMANGAEQIDGFWQNAAAFLLSLRTAHPSFFAAAAEPAAQFRGTARRDKNALLLSQQRRLRKGSFHLSLRQGLPAHAAGRNENRYLF